MVVSKTAPLWQRLPLLPLALAASLLVFLLLPRVRENPRLLWTFVGVTAVLSLWSLALWLAAKRRERTFRIEFASVKSHYVQAIVQGCIYVYWAWHWEEMRAQLPLILAQLLFLYALGALLSWSRGRSFQIGYGPLPIIFSTNLLLWFQDDWFFCQFLMVTAGALGKEFIRWNRDGKDTHIFNPSVFGQSLAAVFLIAFGMTRECTRGEEMAAAFESLPHMLLLIFGLGIAVQYFFSVTLMTLSATAALFLLNLVYTGATGSYFFVTINIGATIFLGLHLLVTDPATSPRSNTGRVIFGALYGLGYAALFRLFDSFDVPVFWDKLLPVPILNLLVPAIDRMAKGGFLGRWDRRWEGMLTPYKLNLVHMGCWAALFGGMLASGFIEGPHEGRSIAFWRKAYKDGKGHAGKNLLAMSRYWSEQGDPEANNMMGVLYYEGDLVEKDDAAAAHYYARACELGYLIGCENVAGLLLTQRRARSPEDVQRALDRLEQGCPQSDGVSCFLAGRAYETGIGRPFDRRRARELYEEGCKRGNSDACEGLTRLGN